MSPLELPEYDPRPGYRYPVFETKAHVFVVWLSRRIFSLFADQEVIGVENLPCQGAAVIAANHLVTYDVFPVQLAIPRMVFYMGKAELFQNKLVHSVFRELGAFPVYRGEKDVWALDHARKVLQSGELLAMFPEGTRSRGKGLALARPGAAKLAIEMGCPLIAVSVDGIQNLFKKFPSRTKVRVVISAPIYPHADEGALSLTDRLMSTMAANLPVELRGVYTEMPVNFENKRREL